MFNSSYIIIESKEAHNGMEYITYLPIFSIPSLIPNGTKDNVINISKASLLYVTSLLNEKY